MEEYERQRATRRARQGPRLAPRRVVLPNAARSLAQGSIRLGLGLGVRPSAPAARRRQRSPPVTRIKHGVLHVHKDYKGLLPVCYYDTGLRDGGPDDGYACFDKRDMLWARLVRFDIAKEQPVNKMRKLFARALPSDILFEARASPPRWGVTQHSSPAKSNERSTYSC